MPWSEFILTLKFGINNYSRPCLLKLITLDFLKQELVIKKFRDFIKS